MPPYVRPRPPVRPPDVHGCAVASSLSAPLACYAMLRSRRQACLKCDCAKRRAAHFTRTAIPPHHRMTDRRADRQTDRRADTQSSNFTRTWPLSVSKSHNSISPYVIPYRRCYGHRLANLASACFWQFADLPLNSSRWQTNEETSSVRFSMCTDMVFSRLCLQ